MSLYLGTSPIALSSSSRNIGEIITSTIPLTDAGLHLLDGSVISGSGSYSAFVTYIAGLYNQTAPSSVTYYAWYNAYRGAIFTLSATPSIGDHYFYYDNGEMYDAYDETNPNPIYITSVNLNVVSSSIGIDGEDAYQYTRDSDIDVTLTVQIPPTYFCSESDWQTSVTNYGVCGKFVYDSVNNTVRLPKITGFTDGTIDPTVLGDLTQAGLPNITGYATLHAQGEANIFYEIAGALNGTGGSTSQYRTPSSLSTNSGAYSKGGIEFNAHNSNPIYGNSGTVQPQSIKVLYYIVIATSITNELNLDVADMADKDFSNITNTGTSIASGWSMPSSRYINLTLGASGSTYTAPANGWVTLQGTCNAGYITISANSITSGDQKNYNGGWLWTLLPVKKGDIVYISYDQFTKDAFRFIYAEGEN